MRRFVGCLSVLIVCLLGTSVDGQTNFDIFHSVNQNVTIRRLTNRVSSFLTFLQYRNITDTLSSQLWDGMTLEQIKANAQAQLPGILTSAQYSAAISKATSLIFTLGPTGIQAAMDTLVGVMANNAAPFFNQLTAYVNKLKSQGMRQQGIAKNSFRIVNSFTTKKRIKTIFTRVSLKFSASKWAAICKALDGIIAFKKNGFVC